MTNHDFWMSISDIINEGFTSLFLLKITAHFHLTIHSTELVVALAGSVFSGKHRLGASLIF